MTARRFSIVIFSAAGILILLSLPLGQTRQGQAQVGNSGFHPEPRPQILLGEHQIGTRGVTTEFKFGHNAAVGNAVFETIWEEGGFYAWPTAAVSMTISSSDADDTSAGAGLQTVAVTCYDDDLEPVIHSPVTMSGQSGVALPADCERVFRIVGLTAGASNGNEGIIYVGTGSITTGKPATVYALLAAPDSVADGDEVNQTQMAFWTCPTTASCIVRRMVFSASDDIAYRIKYRETGGLWREFLKGEVLGSPTDPLAVSGEFLMSGGSDIELQAVGLGGATAGVGAWFTIDIIRQ